MQIKNGANKSRIVEWHVLFRNENWKVEWHVFSILCKAILVF